MYSHPRYCILGENQMPGPATMDAAIGEVHGYLSKHVDADVTPCLCLCDDDSVLLEVDRNGLPFRLVLCRHCGIVRVDPQPDEEALQWFYTSFYRPIYGPHIDGEQLFEQMAWKGHLVREVLIDAGLTEVDGDIVDLGCGGGWTLQALSGFVSQPAGAARLGYDFDNKLLALGRNREFEHRHGGVDAALIDGVQAGLLISAHVLEHTKDPVAYLKSLRPLATASGKLYLEVPHFRRVREVLACDARQYWQRAHLWDFQRAHLEVVARRAGWQPITSREDRLSIMLVCELAEPAPSFKLPELGESVATMLSHCECKRSSVVFRAKRGAYFAARSLKRLLIGPHSPSK